MPVIAIANQKGGVGKTLTTLSLAAAASARGERCLVIDLDPQGNATTGLGVDTDTLDHTVNDVLVDPPIALADVIHPVQDDSWHNIDVAPASLNLGNRERDGDAFMPFKLRKAMRAKPLPRYDLVVIDCPPSVGHLLVAALIAADAVLIVTEASVDSLRGVMNVQQTISTVREDLNPALRIAGILINARQHNREQDAREQELRAAFGDQVLTTVLPRRADAATAHGASASVFTYRGKGAADLRVLIGDVYDELQARTWLPARGASA